MRFQAEKAKGESLVFSELQSQIYIQARAFFKKKVLKKSCSWHNVIGNAIYK